jgi:hypothetical protein
VENGAGHGAMPGCRRFIADIVKDAQPGDSHSMVALRNIESLQQDCYTVGLRGASMAGIGSA